jgi:hypothetical protein
LTQTQFQQGKTGAKGPLEVEIYNKGFGKFLKMALGTSATTQPSVGTDPTVYDHTLGQLTDRLVSWDEPAFRAKQVWSQLWKRAAETSSQHKHWERDKQETPSWSNPGSLAERPKYSPSSFEQDLREVYELLFAVGAWGLRRDDGSAGLAHDDRGGSQARHQIEA